MKETPFGAIFMTFNNEKFGGDKGLKSNISVLNIVNQYDRDSRTFLIRCKQIEITMEDVDHLWSTYQQVRFHNE